MTLFTSFSAFDSKFCSRFLIQDPITAISVLKLEIDPSISAILFSSSSVSYSSFTSTMIASLKLVTSFIPFLPCFYIELTPSMMPFLNLLTSLLILFLTLTIDSTLVSISLLTSLKNYTFIFLTSNLQMPTPCLNVAISFSSPSFLVFQIFTSLTSQMKVLDLTMIYLDRWRVWTGFWYKIRTFPKKNFFLNYSDVKLFYLVKLYIWNLITKDLIFITSFFCVFLGFQYHVSHNLNFLQPRPWVCFEQLCPKISCYSSI